MHQSDTLVIIIETLLLVLASAVCSGLNIAVMSIDMRELRRKAKLGDKAAKLVLPFKTNIHQTLVSILFTNIAAVSATSLVLDQKFNSWIAGLLSTVLIVIFGEVMPQALFGKDPLLWASRLSPALWFMRYVTYIFSKPLQLFLDKIFPRTSGKLQSRAELGLMITEHLSDSTSELDDDEAEMIKGALLLSKKRVRDILTDIRHTYWKTLDTKLDGDTIDEIKEKGHSRIPVFNHQLTECYGLLLLKDLVDIDFDNNNYEVKDMPLHPVQLVGSMTALDTMFRKFISARTHLIPIEKDDVIIGIVTIEDLFEEILGHEIEDETDQRRKHH